MLLPGQVSWNAKRHSVTPAGQGRQSCVLSEQCSPQAWQDTAVFGDKRCAVKEEKETCTNQVAVEVVTTREMFCEELYGLRTEAFPDSVTHLGELEAWSSTLGFFFFLFVLVAWLSWAIRSIMMAEYVLPFALAAAAYPRGDMAWQGSSGLHALVQQCREMVFNL